MCERFAHLLCGITAGMLWLLVVPGSVQGDGLRYSLGSIQEEIALQVEAGGVVSTSLGFYNIDGNVPTSVELSIVEAPAAWSVFMERDGQESATSGVASLVVQPSEPLAVAPGTVAEGRKAVWLAPRGYVCADVVRVIIAVPPDTPTGTSAMVRLAATAKWLRDGSVAPLPQERAFTFDVVVTPTVPEAPTGETLPSGVRVPMLLATVLCLAGVGTGMRLLAKSGRVA